MIYVLYTLEVIVCLFLILVVLLQQGSGADLSVFGGGATQTAFGARGTTQFIHKLTVWFFVAFIVLTLGIAVLKGGPSASSVMRGVATEAGVPGATTPDVVPPGAEAVEPEVAPEASPTTELMIEEMAPEGDVEAEILPPGTREEGGGDDPQ
ncbi:MAG TPA: preprotein translocase subunit SecG [Thermoanaerobaculia bacterium]|nr:preprotein translocase subunit SecG [Thermoanaerobaculia bacterium]